MEVVKAALRLGLGAQRSIAISVAHKNHSYGQLLTSAWKLCTVFKEQHASLIHDPDIAAPAVGCKLMFHGDEMEKKTVQKSGTKGNAGPGRFEVRTLGNCEGVRVAVMANPCAEFVSGMWATWLSGAVVVPLAHGYPQAELFHIVSDADVSLILGTEEYQGFLEDLAKSCSAEFCLVPRVPTFDESEMESAIEKLQDGCTTDVYFEEILTEMLVMPSVQGEKPGLIIYTSGTTGKPKGVVHTHASMAAQVKMLTKAWDYTSNDWFLHCLPLNHVHGLFNMLLAPLYVGAKVHGYDFLGQDILL